MGTTSAASTQRPAAPWRALFLEHVQAMDAPNFVLSSVRRVPASAGYGVATAADDDGGSSTLLVPRARVCVFRGLWADMRVNPKNEAALNPEAYDSDMPTFTTDVRMDKLPELFGALDPRGSSEDTAAWNGTGGGGPVEAVFWCEGPQVQWRIRGRAYVLAPGDVEDEAGGGESARKVLVARMRRRRQQDGESKGKGEAEEGEQQQQQSAWSFSREITAHFGNLSPGMRGSWRNPPPGQPKDAPNGDERLGLGQKVTDNGDEVARRNFRVVVIVPHEVDRTDLSDPAEGKRWIYSVAAGDVEAGDRWDVVETWP